MDPFHMPLLNLAKSALSESWKQCSSIMFVIVFCEFEKLETKWCANITSFTVVNNILIFKKKKKKNKAFLPFKMLAECNAASTLQ